jgi:hypothetical protein
VNNYVGRWNVDAGRFDAGAEQSMSMACTDCMYYKEATKLRPSLAMAYATRSNAAGIALFPSSGQSAGQ